LVFLQFSKDIAQRSHEQAWLLRLDVSSALGWPPEKREIQFCARRAAAVHKFTNYER
jgi:hypothetical protein